LEGLDFLGDMIVVRKAETSPASMLSKLEPSRNGLNGGDNKDALCSSEIMKGVAGDM